MKLLHVFFALFIISNSLFAQTTATDFTTDDCNGISHNLFNQLDSGNVIVIAWVMPCGPCATFALYAYSAVQSFSASHPGRVHFYLVDDFANTDCNTLVNWGSTNNMPLNTAFSSSDISMSDYGTNGMPKVVVLGGGATHTVYLNMNNNTINFTDVKSAINQALLPPSIIEENKNGAFKISSLNLAQGILNVSYSNFFSERISFMIIDVIGRVVYSSEENESYSKVGIMKSINIRDLDRGKYFLRISSKNISETLPFLVSN